MVLPRIEIMSRVEVEVEVLSLTFQKPIEVGNSTFLVITNMHLIKKDSIPTNPSHRSNPLMKETVY